VAILVGRAIGDKDMHDIKGADEGVGENEQNKGTE